MFGINIRQLKVMEYQCSPVTDGKTSVAIGVAGIVLTAAIIATKAGCRRGNWLYWQWLT